MVDGRQEPPKQGSGEGRREGGRRRRRGRGGQKPGDKAASATGQRPAPGATNHKRPDGRPPKAQKPGQKPSHNGGRPPRSDSPSKVEKRPEKPEAPFVHVTKRYGVVIYDTLQAARADLPSIAEQAKGFDQLNVVIRAEANMDDPELNAIANVKVFAGTAWALIHDRRIQDGWYDAPR